MTTAPHAERVPQARPDTPARAVRPLARRLPALILPLGAIGVWQAVTWIWHPREWLLPSPATVLSTLADERSRLWFHTLGTLRGALAGFALAAVAGACLAAAITWSRAIDRAVYPWAIASQAIPILSLAPLFPIWLDYGPSRLLVAALVAFFPVVVAGVDGLRAVDPEIARMLRTLGARPGWIWRHGTLPAALPALFSGLKMAAVFSVTGAVVAEYVGADRGLGYLSEIATGQFRTDVVFAAILCLSVLGVALFGLVAAAERLALPHRHRSTKPTRRFT